MNMLVKLSGKKVGTAISRSIREYDGARFRARLLIACCCHSHLRDRITRADSPGEPLGQNAAASTACYSQDDAAYNRLTAMHDSVQADHYGKTTSTQL